MSDKIINNLQSQLKIYQQMFEQLENNSEAPIPSPLTSDIAKPKTGYIKTEELLKLFNITKVQYNNILVRTNDILLF